MKHYKHITTNEIVGEGLQDSSYALMTPEEFEEFRNPTKTALQLQEEARQAEKTARQEALNSMTHTLADGAVVQTRPSDLTNFQIAIDIGLSKDWVLADNTVRLLTVVEMGECLMSGIGQADVIWTAYTDFLKAN